MELISPPLNNTNQPKATPVQHFVPLDQGTYRRLIKYADSTGQSLSAAAKRAINHFWETEGISMWEQANRQHAELDRIECAGPEPNEQADIRFVEKVVAFRSKRSKSAS
jgi:hypothetical protein